MRQRCYSLVLQDLYAWYIVRDRGSSRFVEPGAGGMIAEVGRRRQMGGCAITARYSSVQSSSLSSSHVSMLCGYRRVSALGLGLTSITLLSGVQCEFVSDVVYELYCLKPFATISDMSTSDS
jgi:hypothetical protein